MAAQNSAYIALLALIHILFHFQRSCDKIFVIDWLGKNDF